MCKCPNGKRGGSKEGKPYESVAELPAEPVA